MVFSFFTMPKEASKMQKQVLVVLTVDQVREALADHYADFLTSNKDSLLTMIRTGKLTDVPNLQNKSADDLAKLYRENLVGATVAKVEQVNMVAVQIGTRLEVVYTAPPVVPVQIDAPLPNQTATPVVSDGAKPAETPAAKPVSASQPSFFITW